MLTCPNPDVCSSYVDNELSEMSKTELELHLKECDRCSSLVARYKGLKKLIALDEVPEIDLDASFAKLQLKRHKKSLSFTCLFLKYKMKIISLGCSCSLLLFFLFFAIYSDMFGGLFMNYHPNEEFQPIIPLSYKAQKKLNPVHIDLSRANLFIDSYKRKDYKIYKNFLNGFNSFTTLYSSLNDYNYSTLTYSDRNNTDYYQYVSNIPIYGSLNRNAK